MPSNVIVDILQPLTMKFTLLFVVGFCFVTSFSVASCTNASCELKPNNTLRNQSVHIILLSEQNSKHWNKTSAVFLAIICSFQNEPTVKFALSMYNKYDGINDNYFNYFPLQFNAAYELCHLDDMLNSSMRMGNGHLCNLLHLLYRNLTTQNTTLYLIAPVFYHSDTNCSFISATERELPLLVAISLSHHYPNQTHYLPLAKWNDTTSISHWLHRIINQEPGASSNSTRNQSSNTPKDTTAETGGADELMFLIIWGAFAVALLLFICLMMSCVGVQRLFLYITGRRDQIRNSTTDRLTKKKTVKSTTAAAVTAAEASMSLADTQEIVTLPLCPPSSTNTRTSSASTSTSTAARTSSASDAKGSTPLTEQICCASTQTETPSPRSDGTADTTREERVDE